MKARKPPVGVPPGSPRAVGAGQTGKTITVNATTAPYPHRNLGPHLKKPASGEYETYHHRGAKK